MSAAAGAARVRTLLAAVTMSCFAVLAEAAVKDSSCCCKRRHKEVSHLCECLLGRRAAAAARMRVHTARGSGGRPSLQALSLSEADRIQQCRDRYCISNVGTGQLPLASIEADVE